MARLSPKRLRVRIAHAVSELRASHGIVPGLAVVLVGNDPASEIYVRNKGIQAKRGGDESSPFALPAETPEETLLNTGATSIATPRFTAFWCNSRFPRRFASKP